MRKLLVMVLAIALCLSCTACACIPVKKAEPETLPPEQLQTEPPTQPATEPLKEPAQQPATKPANLVPKSEVPYTTRLSAALDIYNLPGAYNRYLRDVGISGTYTIVEEDYDEFGNLWGKLKSGAGWVQLSGELPQTNQIRTCLGCSMSEPQVFFDPNDRSEYCDRCNYGHGNGGSVLFCWQCGADCTYRGLMPDGRCEDCYFGY